MKSKLQARIARVVMPVGVVAAALAFAVTSVAAGVTAQTADVVGQGMAGPVVSDDGATIRRSDNGISATLSMPTPTPGSYNYPGPNGFQPNGALYVPGSPEAYSLWMFVFNYPELCVGPCDGGDLGSDKPAKGGAFNAAGHIVGGSSLQLSGHVSTNTAPLFPTMSAVLEPRTAEVHLAVAPHGALDPALLPTQITKPIGNPTFWWISVFGSPS